MSGPASGHGPLPAGGAPTRPLRVAHVTSRYWPALEFGGPVQSVAMLAEAQAREGATVTVFTTTGRGAPHFEPIPPGVRARNGVEVRYYDTVGPRGFAMSIGMARDLAATLARYDVVHLHGLWVFGTAFGARLARWKGVPCVVSPRGTLDGWALSQKAAKKRLYLAAVERGTLARASLVHYTAEGERSGVPAALAGLPSVVVPNPVDLERFLSVPPVSGPPTPLRILMVGRVHRTKGFDLFIPAVGLARARGVDLTLRIAGPDEGGYRREVESMIARAGVGAVVELLGPQTRDQVAAELAAADVVAMPSYTENFGMAAAEAMAAARPVIVSERVNLAPVVAAARAGLVSPLDPARFADAIAELASDPGGRAEMGRRGREAALAQFAPARVAARFLELYRGL